MKRSCNQKEPARNARPARNRYSVSGGHSVAGGIERLIKEWITFPTGDVVVDAQFDKPMILMPIEALKGLIKK